MSKKKIHFEVEEYKVYYVICYTAYYKIHLINENSTGKEASGRQIKHDRKYKRVLGSYNNLTSGNYDISKNVKVKKTFTYLYGFYKKKFFLTMKRNKIYRNLSIDT